MPDRQERRIMTSNQERQTDVWEKWDWLWSAIFTTAVLASTALMLADEERFDPVWLPLLLSAVMLVWHWGGLQGTHEDEAAWEEKHTRRVVVILGDMVLWLVMVNISPAYYFVLFGLFSQVFRHLQIRYAAIAAFLLTMAIIYEQITEGGESFSLANPLVWLYFLLGLGGIVFGIWVSAIIGQSSRRRDLIEELEETQAELAAAERREGVLQERQRLAREIHDTLAQGFTSIVMHLEAAEQALPTDPDTLQKHLERARSTARLSLDEARRVVQDLRPDLLEQQSLPDAIERTAARWSEETAIPATNTTTGDPVALHPNIEVTLLRAAQEALNNVRKHAQAAAVQLTLSYMDDVVILDVQDDGVGLDGAAPSLLSGGYGLQGMRERAEQWGGSVTLESESGEGTTVVVTVPISS
jgi:signal transduction histidine kinase